MLQVVVDIPSKRSRVAIVAMANVVLGFFISNLIFAIVLIDIVVDMSDLMCSSPYTSLTETTETARHYKNIAIRE